MNEADEGKREQPVDLHLALGLAALVYSFIVVWGVMLSWLFDGYWQVWRDPLLLRLQAILMGTAFAAMYGCLLLALVTVSSYPIEWGVRGVQRSLELVWNEPRRAAHTGAWVAFLGVTLFGLSFTRYAYDIDFTRPRTMAFLLLLGPGVATPLFQYAGAWSQWRLEGVDRRGPWRFGIRQVLVTTAWVAATLALLKAGDLLTRDFVAYFVGWLVYQYATMELILQFCARRARRILKGRGGDGGG